MPSSSTRMLAGCGSPWKNPCRKIIVIHASAIRYASSRRSSSGQALSSMSASCVAVEELERQHARPRVPPVDARDADVRVAGEVAAERLGVARLEPVVELLPDRAGELVDELARVDEVEGAHALLHEPRGLVEQREVGLDLPRRVGRCTLTATARRSAAPPGAPVRSTRRRSASRRTRGTPARAQPELLLDHALDLGRTGTAARRPGARAARRRCPAGRRPGRVESSWPNLTNVGPSSSSISRSRRPRSEPVSSSPSARRPTAAGR